MKFIIVVAVLFSALFSFDVEVSSPNIANGKTLLLELHKDKSIDFQNVKFGKKKYKIFDSPLDKEKVYALVPISYYQKPSHLTLKVNYIEDKKSLNKSFSFNVVDGKYAKESIEVDKSKVNPTSKKVKQRIAKEYNEAMKVYNHVSKENYIHSKFILPLDSDITSDFGKARIYNHSLNGYHSGTDFRAKIGTPIIASNDGVVSLVKKRFYSGGTVVIDHGHGIYTCYFHMSKFDVKKGEVVKKGQIIGLSGKSGRVTGPHLHFAARVEGVQVDPLQLINLLNTKLL